METPLNPPPTEASRVRRFSQRWAGPLLLLVFIITTGGIFWHLCQRVESLYTELPLQGVELQVVTVQAFRKAYTEDVVEPARRQGIVVSHDPHREDGSIPLPATFTMRLGDRLSEYRPGARVRLYSDYPFPWRNDGGAQDAFERDALTTVRNNPDQPFYRFETVEGRPSLRYAVADRMFANCVACHNSHPDSPKTDWKEGDVRGVLEFIRPLDEQVAEGRRAQQWGFSLAVVVNTLGVGGLGLVYYRLRRATETLSEEAARTQALMDAAHDCIITVDHNGRIQDVNPATEKTFCSSREQLLGKPLDALIGPVPADGGENRLAELPPTPDWKSAIGRRVEMLAGRPDGTVFPAELAISDIAKSHPQLFCLYLRDLTDQKAAAALLRDSNNQLAEQNRLAALRGEVGFALNKGGALADILHDCCDTIQRYTAAAFVRVWTLNEAEQVLELQASVGLYTHTNGPHARVPVGKFKIGRIAQNRMPHLTNSVTTDPQVGDPEWAAREGMVAFAGHPLIVGDQVVGVLALFASHPLSDAVLDALQGVADAIALGVVRVRTEAALRANEERLKTVYETALDGIITTDECGRIESLNSATIRLFGYSQEELLGQNVRILIPQPHRSCHDEYLQNYLRTGVSQVVGRKRVVIGSRKDGSPISVEFSVNETWLNGKRLFVSVLRDNTDRKASEDILRASEERHRFLFDCNPESMWVCDAATSNFLAVNQTAVRHYGYTHAEFLSMAARDIELEFATERPPTANPGHARLTRHRLASGETRQVEVTASTIEFGGRPAWLMMCIDVTERKQEVEQLHQELVATARHVGMAEVATNVLHNVGNVLNSVNVSAELVAERVRKSKGVDLTRVVELLEAHQGDLGQFVTTDPRGKHTTAYLAQLAAHLLNERETIAKELDGLRRNVDHIKEIVAMQQNYAKPSGLREAVSVTDLVEDSLRMNTGALGRHGVAVEREFGDVPPINVDKHKVLQILVNLIRNAKYACDESSRSDRRVTVRVAGSDDRITIAVIDNGVGIPEENLTRIFHHGFTTRALGHGFGLHSSALAAKELGGSLTVRSEGTDRGATFTLELPLHAPGDLS
jgi:PAS domain S-box-containing protein